MVDVAKNNNPNVIKYGSALPSNVPKAVAVSTPASIDPFCQSPDMTIVIPVMEQTINVSMGTCVMETRACLPGISVLAAAAAIGAEPNWWYSNYEQHPNINILVNQVETCKEMVINGLGYAIIANLIVRPYPELVIKNLIDQTGSPITRKTWMYYHEDSLQINIVKAFVRFIKTLDVKAL